MAPESFSEQAGAPSARSVAATGRSVGSGQWTAGGWTLYVPPGWEGTEGTGARLLQLTSIRDGHRLEVTRGALPLDASCTFDSTGTYRGPARLVVERTRTCLGDGRVAMDWSTRTHGEEVWVRVSFLEGRAFAGRQAVTPLLDSLDRR